MIKGKKKKKKSVVGLRVLKKKKLISINNWT